MNLEAINKLASDIRREVGRVVRGQDAALDRLLTALLADGHVLIEGVPGTAKTLLVRAFARALALDFKRIQFTPDLMPGDVIGTNLFNFATGEFRLTRGPIFTSMLLADEINRTPPKTQAALLQAMQEREVTIDGTTHSLPAIFFVAATRNPIENEGTYPLPEAQLDRFLFEVRIRYPDRDAEREIVSLHGRSAAGMSLDDGVITVVAGEAEIIAARAEVQEIRLSDEILDYVVDIVRATRDDPALHCGASPRAAAMLCGALRARAALDGRDYVLPDDVKELAPDVLAHRVILAPAAELEGFTPIDAIARVVDGIRAPR